MSIKFYTSQKNLYPQNKFLATPLKRKTALQTAITPAHARLRYTKFRELWSVNDENGTGVSTNSTGGHHAGHCHAF